MWKTVCSSTLVPVDETHNNTAYVQVYLCIQISYNATRSFTSPKQQQLSTQPKLFKLWSKHHGTNKQKACLFLIPVVSFNSLIIQTMGKKTKKQTKKTQVTEMRSEENCEINKQKTCYFVTSSVPLCTFEKVIYSHNDEFK